jgi:hypothetical protein
MKEIAERQARSNASFGELFSTRTDPETCVKLDQAK